LARARETQAERRARQRAEEDARREEAFGKTRNAERSYGAQLRNLARQIARIVEAHAPLAEEATFSPAAVARIQAALAAYGTAITPWARATAARMIAEVHLRDRAAWERYTRGMSRALRVELNATPIGEAMAAVLAEQVHLITSLPLEAAQRVQETSQNALYTAARYPERTAEIEAALEEAHPRATEAWLKARATLIARTETARTASVLVQSRAEHVGAESYVWTTAGDWKVRPSHKKLEGTVQRWDAPPLSDPPDYHSHPGMIWNCRCTALPIIPG
jgi:SPP1 gp7 family putative phage head morphogenesis protein